jgi:hypothetical protein
VHYKRGQVHIRRNMYLSPFVVPRLRTTGDVAEQMAKSVDESTPHPWVERHSRKDRRSVLWHRTRFHGRALRPKVLCPRVVSSILVGDTEIG